MSGPVDISVVLNIHREASFLGATLMSLAACLKEAASAGLVCELISVFDRSDSATKRVFERWLHLAESHLDDINIVVLEVSVGSLSLARNAGVQVATGEYIWTADADDLTSSNSLVALYRLASSCGQHKAAFYLEYMVLFGSKYHINKYSDGSLLSVADFCFEHPYVSRIFLLRESFQPHAYRPMDCGCGYAFEDWDLACRLKRDNYNFFVAPETILFYRQRHGSIMSVTSKTSILPPSSFFEPGWLPLQLISDIGSGKSYADFIACRLNHVDKDYAKELQQSHGMHGFLLEVCAMDPEVDYHKIVNSSSWSVLDHPGHHLGHKLAELFGLVGRQPFTDLVITSSSHSDDPESLAREILLSLASRDSDSRVLVIAIDHSCVDRWLDQLPQNSVVLDLFYLFPGLDSHDCDRLTVRLALSTCLNGARLHLLPSESCHRLMADFASPLLCHFRGLYYRCHDVYRSIQGRSLFEASVVHFLRQHLSRLAFVIFNSTALLEADHVLLGLDPEVCLLLPQDGIDRLTIAFGGPCR